MRARNFGLKGHFWDPGFDQKIHWGIWENASYLTETSLQLHGKRDWPKFKHWTRAGLFCQYVDNSANYTFERQLLNQPGVH